MDSKMWAYHSYVSMYQDADSGLSGPVIVYNPGKMDEVMANNREFVIFYGDNQESNSFLALHNVQKYLPNVYPTVANLSSEYPQPTMNQTFWRPQMINTPLTNVSTTMAPNFFPVCFSIPSYRLLVH
jgi:manganese oxidase